MVDHNDEFGSSAPPPGGGSENLNYGEPNPGGAVGDPSSPPANRSRISQATRPTSNIPTRPPSRPTTGPSIPSSRWCSAQ